MFLIHASKPRSTTSRQYLKKKKSKVTDLYIVVFFLYEVLLIQLIHTSENILRSLRIKYTIFFNLSSKK